MVIERKIFSFPFIRCAIPKVESTLTLRNGLPVIRKAKCCYCGMNCGVDDSKVIIIKQDGHMVVQTLHTRHVQF